MKKRILVVDDEPIVRELLERTLGGGEYDLETCDGGAAALEHLRSRFFNVLITDLKMPKVSGLDVLREVKKINPYTEVIIITGYPTIEGAVDAIKIGAFDFICKPFDILELKSTVSRCIERQSSSINHIELSELMTLFEISKTLTANIDPGFLFDSILKAALRLVKADRGSLMLREGNTLVRIRSAFGLKDDIVKQSFVPPEESIVGKVLRTGQPFIGREHDPQMADRRGYRSKYFVSLPLVSRYLQEGHVFGVINVTDKLVDEPFSDRDMTLLSVLVGEAAAIIENYRLYGQLLEKVDVLKRIIRELDETEKQLFQSEKLAAVGQLAFGIAHEIRNPLAIIMMGVESLNNTVRPQGEDESIAIIKKSIGRANNIITDLLQFSRSSTLQAGDVDVARLFDEVTSLIKNEAYLKNVKVEKLVSDHPLVISADMNLLRQVFFNLSSNALDAMPSGGTLSFCASLDPDGRYMTAKVSDTGTGIPEEIREKIFNPFFTTKGPGKGTGLGLSIVHLILERHGGSIEVDSQAGKGTTFTLKVPVQCVLGTEPAMEGGRGHGE
ncbi:MAG: ATP-binding protein [Deltaproteobacteria bacterium]